MTQLLGTLTIQKRLTATLSVMPALSGAISSSLRLSGDVVLAGIDLIFGKLLTEASETLITEAGDNITQETG